MKIATIVGARPNFIKLGPLSNALRANHEEVIIHTGQHYDEELSDFFFNDLGISKPNYNLEVGSGTHGEQTARILERIEKVLISEKPDFVVVFGDTNSSMAAALAARKLRVHLAHVEAGMRNFDRNKPEEINRKIIDHISDINFPPTESARKNLENEGITDNVHLVGDVTCDVLKSNLERARDKSTFFSEFSVKEGDYLLFTCHKSINTDDSSRLRKIMTALSNLEYKVIFPLHPRTRNKIQEFNLFDLIEKENIIVTEPLGYLDMLQALNGCQKVVTDSGGIQKEAFVLEKPCITLRETEWVETVAEGWNRIIDLEKDEIVSVINEFMPIKSPNNIFGQSGVSERIIEIIENF